MMTVLMRRNQHVLDGAGDEVVLGWALTSAS